MYIAHHPTVDVAHASLNYNISAATQRPISQYCSGSYWLLAVTVT